MLNILNTSLEPGYHPDQMHTLQSKTFPQYKVYWYVVTAVVYNQIVYFIPDCKFVGAVVCTDNVTSLQLTTDPLHVCQLPVS